VRLVAILTLLLLAVACRPDSGSGTTADPAASAESTSAVTPTTTQVPASSETTQQPSTPEESSGSPTLAEQTLARAPAIDEALGRIAVPQEGDLAATVNGEEITMERLRAYMRLRMENLSSQYGIDWTQSESESVLSQLQAEVLEQLIEMALIRQGADQAGVIADPAELAGLTFEVQQSILQSQGFESWEQYLSAMGLSDQEFTSILEESLLVNALVEDQDAPSEAEQVHARHILVTDPDLAEDLATQLAADADFAELAAANSVDTSTASNGGDLGWFPRGIMVPEFEDAAFGLAPGERSAVIPTSYGYHIIEVLETGTRELSLPHRQQMQQIAFMDWLEKARAEAEIERYILEAVG